MATAQEQEHAQKVEKGNSYAHLFFSLLSISLWTILTCLAVSQFSITAEKLSSLFESRNEEQYQEYGGLSGIAESLKTNLSSGLLTENEEDLENRKLAFGRNVLPSPENKSFWAFFSEAYLEDRLLHILTVASIVSIGLGVIDEHERSHGWIEGFAIFLAVFIVTFVTALQDWQKQRQFRQLEKVKDERWVKVVRDGQDSEILIFDVLAGDLVKLDTGDYVPADGLYVSGSDLRTDEACMTGEIDMIKKNEKRPFLLGGTSVAQGVGIYLVCAVGMNSQWGNAMKLISASADAKEKTPLQEKLTKLADSTLIWFIIF